MEIFEAIVAMPLWALAHLRIDGDGMPGQAAIGGYQLLLMILLRPAMIVIGLIGGYVIFGGAMYYFTTLFNSAVAITRDELSGGETYFMGVMVYTIFYTFLAYNIALMCFKMIDDVPKGMLRWLGASVSTFGDSREDPIQGSQAALVGAVAAGSTVGGAIGQSMQGDETGRGGFSRGFSQLGGNSGGSSGGATGGGGSGGNPSGGGGGSGGSSPQQPISPSHQLGGSSGGGGNPSGGGGSGNPHKEGSTMHRLHERMNDSSLTKNERNAAKNQYDNRNNSDK